jgi:hypothetical protein
MARFVEYILVPKDIAQTESAPITGDIESGEEGGELTAGKKRVATASVIAPPDDDRTLKSALEQVARFIPTEILAAYVTLFTATNALDVDQHATERLVFFGLAFGLGLVGTWFYVAKMVANPQYRLPNQIMATIAFVVWAYSYPVGIFNDLKWYYSLAALFALITFTLVSGLIDIRPAEDRRP